MLLRAGDITAAPRAGAAYRAHPIANTIVQSMFLPPLAQLRGMIALVPLNASEGLFDGRGQRVVIGVEDEDSEQLCRLGLARVAADRMDRARRFGPALACPIDARLFFHLMTAIAALSAFRSATWMLVAYRVSSSPLQN